MKIGILGCGYVGEAAASFWKKSGRTISVTTRQPERIESLKQVADEVHLLDSPHSLAEFLKSLDALLIAVAPGPHGDYQTTYLNTARDIAQFLPETPHLNQIVYTSSTSVYGDHQGNWVDEETPVSPLNDKARILVETEETLICAASDTRAVCILRLGEIIGPGRTLEERLKRMHQQLFPGDGNQYTNLIHLDDIVQACDLALTQKLNGIFNLCSDLHIPRKELYQALCQQLGLPQIKWSGGISPHGGNKRVSSNKIKKMGMVFKDWEG